MFYSKALVHDVETNTFDANNECLVTDLVHELSSGLEIPLLDGNVKSVSKDENFSALDSLFYEESVKENEGDSYFNFSKNCENSLIIKDELNYDIESFLDKKGNDRTYSTSGFSGSGSGSECSSTELWNTKTELDTPPVTPPDERISPDTVFFLSSEEPKFMPICLEETQGKEFQIKNDNKSINKRVRIQPKPISTSLQLFDNQPVGIKVMCNVFNNDNVNIVSQESSVDSNFFINSDFSKKKSLLSKKDQELLQAKRKQERMIRNRESAYLSRKRKKEHVANLEKQVEELQIENKQLKIENNILKQRLSKYEDLGPLSGKKAGNLFTDSPRKTTALLALLVTVCLNIGSFSSFINERNYRSDNVGLQDNVVPSYSSELRHTRSLLWADNDLGNMTSTYSNITKTSCPLSVNQTESIRLESELRKWIGGDDDYSRKDKYNVSKISQYFYLGDRPSMRKKKLKRKLRSKKLNFQKKLELNMYDMNALNFNTFFEAIHRRDDTFYLVSFSGDHLLLPALSHNQTSRPKMSLMLPSFLSNGTGADQVEMMQIDCEVTNTQLVSVKENDIPSSMRPYSNETSRSKDKVKENFNLEELFVSDLPVTFGPVVEKPQINELDSLKNNAFFKNFSLFKDSHFRISNNNVSQYSTEKGSSKVFVNETYKQDLSDVLSGTRKNLLKLLMVGQAVGNSHSQKDSKKSFYSNQKNSSDVLFN